MMNESHVCDSKCVEERERLAPLDTYFAQCIEGRAQLYTAHNDRFECPRVQNEYDRLVQLCTIARMTRPGSRNDLRNEE